MQPECRNKSVKSGRWAEQVAAELLVTKGYAIKARNWRMSHYEIDIVAQDGDSVVFVEVKMRAAGAEDPVSAVNSRKRARMIASADAYMHQYDLPFEYRFDIVAITGDPSSFTIEHIPDAFFPPLKKHSYNFRL